MIYDTMGNADLYAGTNSRLGKALIWLKNIEESIGEGRHDIDADNVFAIVASYTTKTDPAAQFEAHHKYIDIQILLSGSERVDVTIDQTGEVVTAYDDATDAEMTAPPQEWSSIILRPGMVTVLFPQDVHRPGMAIDTPAPVRKVVAKVRI